MLCPSLYLSYFDKTQKLCSAASFVIVNLNSGFFGIGQGIINTLRIVLVMLLGHSGGAVELQVRKICE